VATEASPTKLAIALVYWYMSAFPWHSTVASGGFAGGCPQRTEAHDKIDPATLVPMYHGVLGWLETAPRSADGRVQDSAPLIAALRSRGAKLDVEGTGTLLAILDRRAPTWEEFVRCCGVPPHAALAVKPQLRAGGGAGAGAGADTNRQGGSKLKGLCGAANSASAPSSRAPTRPAQRPMKGR